MSLSKEDALLSGCLKVCLTVNVTVLLPSWERSCTPSLTNFTAPYSIEVMQWAAREEKLENSFNY